jgi:hypothetical protein
MEENENVFPMDVVDASSRPWTFRPQGYLVAILADADEAHRAEAALAKAGLASHDIKLYTADQILENHERYISRRGVVSKVAGAIADDSEGRELYLGYARDDRCAMWVRIPDEARFARRSSCSPITTPSTSATTARRGSTTTTPHDAERGRPPSSCARAASDVPRSKESYRRDTAMPAFS